MPLSKRSPPRQGSKALSAGCIAVGQTEMGAKAASLYKCHIVLERILFAFLCRQQKAWKALQTPDRLVRLFKQNPCGAACLILCGACVCVCVRISYKGVLGKWRRFSLTVCDNAISYRRLEKLHSFRHVDSSAFDVSPGE